MPAVYLVTQLLGAKFVCCEPVLAAFDNREVILARE